MRMRTLGRDGPRISVLGMGTWAIGGPDTPFGWGPQDDDASVAAIRRALDKGVNWIDTAAVYGWGHSEEIVARAVGDRDEVLVFTKCGVVPGPAPGTRVLDLSPASVRAECEASLRRLGRDCIDLYQFHWPMEDDRVPVEDSWATMRELVDEGKVRWPGVSNFDVDLLERCEGGGHVQSLQPPYSLIRRGAEVDLLPWCRDHATGVVAYSPMQAGLLTGSFDQAKLDSLDAGDWRRDNPQFQEPRLSRNLDLVERIRPIADELDASVAELALAYVLAHPAVTGAIVGARSPEQVEGWIGAGQLDIGTLAEDLREIAEETLTPRE